MLKKAFFLIVLVFCGSAISWILYSNSKKEASSIERVRSYIQKSTLNEVSTACHLHNDLAARFKKQTELKFQDFPELTDQSLFIYVNDSLIYWSDYKISPGDAIESSKGDVTFFQNSLGDFLVVADHYFVKNQKIDFYSIITLERSFQIVNKYLEGGVNKDLYPKASLVSINAEKVEGGEIYDENGEYLFSVASLLSSSTAVPLSSWWVVTLFISLLIFITAIHLILKLLYISNRYGLSIFLEVLFLVLIRALMLYFEFPNRFTQFWLFDPEYYASSTLAPSLGDLLLNALVLARVGWLFFRNLRHIRFLHVGKFNDSSAKFVTCIIVLLLSFFSAYFFEYIIGGIYQNSQDNYDVSFSLEWSWVEFIYLSIFIILALTYFGINHVISRVYSHFFKKINFTSIGLILFSFSIFYFLYAYFDLGNVLIPIFHFLYITLVFIARLSKTLIRFTQSAYLYIVMCGFTIALMGSSLIATSSKEKQNWAKKNFAKGMLTEYDLLGEYLLVDSRKNIQEDNFIKGLMLNPLSSKDLIVQKIKRVYLSNYFDKYDVHVYIFDNQGNAFYTDNEDVTFAGLVKTYKRAEFKTKVSNLYYVNEYERNVLNRFLNFVNIEKNGRSIGYIVLDLKLKKIIPHSVYPRLLVDNKYIKDVHEQDFQYAIYLKNDLQYSFGTYNYKGLLSKENIQDDKILLNGIEQNGYHHLMLKSDGGKQVVVTSKAYTFTNWFSNFSFLFLILVFIILCIIICYAVYYRFRPINVNFSTKIQIYLNIAYFLPLVVVSVTTLSTINNSYFEDLRNSFQSKAESIGGNISDYLEGNIQGEFTDEYLTTAILRVARYTETDLNLFNESGQLLLSSQPLIYESGLLSEQINPKAYRALIHSQSQMVMLQEEIGGLSFNTVYMAVKSNKSGDQIGILSIPFFNSEFYLDKKRTEVLTTIMNIFTSFFLIFLMMSYIASRSLIVPLKLITQKIRKTTLGGNNEKLEWNSDDEIGLLVNEYNEMIQKLEKSTEELAKTEKESAWREMAQQVAHEIKNPLTPMKLTLQHLQRKVASEAPDEPLSKSINTLLDQVETLNDIATSFSSFAKMPIPKMERFDVRETLLRTVTLYNNNDGINVNSEISDGSFLVSGDEKLMGRIFTNLILNGIQSVPEGREADVHISLEKVDRTVQIRIQDNGSGISEDIKDKVFIPNFSTKYAGSGIGLAVAKRGIVHAGGKIWFETTLNVGTVFYIELPLIDQSTQ